MDNQDFMKYKICTPRDPKFIKMLEDEYNSSNISLIELSKKYHTDAGYQFKIHGIKKRTSGEQVSMTRTGYIKLNWIGKKIETEEQAYIAGLFMADGYVGKNQAGLRLKKSDKELLEKVKNYFSEEIKTQEESNSYSFVISSKQLCENFVSLGIYRNKTNKELHIPSMDTSLIRHFIRGFFDGDGSVFLCHNNGYTTLRCSICSTTKNILESFNEVLRNHNILGTINKESRKGKYTHLIEGRIVENNLDMYRLYVRSKKCVKNLYHFFYDNSTIWLNRKREKFEENTTLLNYKKSIC